LGALAAFAGPGEKVVTVLLLVAVAGVVGVRSPILLAAVPTLAWRFLGDVPFYWSWMWHYDAVLMPPAVAALLDALEPRPEPDAARAVPDDGAVPPARRHRRRVLGALAAAGLAVVLAAPGLP